MSCEAVRKNPSILNCGRFAFHKILSFADGPSLEKPFGFEELRIAERTSGVEALLQRKARLRRPIRFSASSVDPFITMRADDDRSVRRRDAAFQIWRAASFRGPSGNDDCMSVIDDSASFSGLPSCSFTKASITPNQSFSGVVSSRLNVSIRDHQSHQAAGKSMTFFRPSPHRLAIFL